MNLRQPLQLFLLFALLGVSSLIVNQQAQASIYFEVGTSAGNMISPSAYFQQPLSKPGLGFVGSFSAYIPYKPKSWFHFDFGLQNRLTLTNSKNESGNSQSFSMFTPNIAVRIEFWRFFIGGGFSPLPYSSKASAGLTSLRPTPKATSYFMETGMIWRVIPEFQIVLAAGAEFASVNGTVSPSPSIEYGFRFRFPLNPKDYAAGSGGVKFDGLRYPFGFMK
jgi:hypothetical protein